MDLGEGIIVSNWYELRVLKLDIKNENTKSIKCQVRAILLSRETLICPSPSKILVFADDCYSVLI